MEEAGFKQIRHPSGQKFAEVELKRNSYKDWEKHGTYGDFHNMLVKVRKGLYDQLLSGTMDRHGEAHDNEKRACMFVMDTILGYIPSIYFEYERLLKEKERLEDKAARAGLNIHGDDYIRTQLDNM